MSPVKKTEEKKMSPQPANNGFGFDEAKVAPFAGGNTASSTGFDWGTGGNGFGNTGVRKAAESSAEPEFDFS